MLRVHIVDILPHDTSPREQEQRMIELERLVTTYGGLVIVKTIQRKDSPAYRTYIGEGKLDMIVEDMIASQSDLLIVWNILKPSQIYQINEKLRKHNLQAWDKVDLILKIFDKHAESAEAKMQIELAAIKHMGPRIFGMGMEMSRQGWWSSGGAGAARWLGETNTERMRRHLKEKVRAIESKLKEYERTRGLQRARRKRIWLPVCGIVWYTNAGKSSLLRAMCKKDAYVADKLFATLGTEVGKMYLTPTPLPDGEGLSFEGRKSGKEVLLIDTIGFIRELPPQLIKAFASTLEDSIQSDLLLHVIDASDPDYQTKIEVVEDILHRIHADQQVIYVFNKIDQIDSLHQKTITDVYQDRPHVFVSAQIGLGLEELKEMIGERV